MQYCFTLSFIKAELGSKRGERKGTGEGGNGSRGHGGFPVVRRGWERAKEVVQEEKGEGEGGGPLQIGGQDSTTQLSFEEPQLRGTSKTAELLVPPLLGVPGPQ